MRIFFPDLQHLRAHQWFCCCAKNYQQVNRKFARLSCVSLCRNEMAKYRPIPGWSFTNGKWRDRKSHDLLHGRHRGGVWKTVDGGNTWVCVSDTAFHSSSVGALAVAASDPNVIYVGMGEAAIRNTAIMGDGIYKSIDAGKTWKHVLTLDASAVGRIIINPKKSGYRLCSDYGKNVWNQ